MGKNNDKAKRRVRIEKKNKRDFKGIWIPKEIWLKGDLSITDKVFLAEIDSLDGSPGCFASNEYFAKFFRLSEKRVSVVINKLVKAGRVTSTIKKTRAGTERILHLTHPPEMGSAHPPETSTSPPPGNGHHITKPKTKDSKEITKNKALLKSSSQILDLDLKIAGQKNFFISQIEKILKPSKASAKTLASVTRYLVVECQAGRLRVSIFKDLIEAARQAKAGRTVRNPIAMFVSVVKKKTGFKKQGKIL